MFGLLKLHGARVSLACPASVLVSAREPSFACAKTPHPRASLAWLHAQTIATIPTLELR
jgi:hypothetical protein